MIELLLAPILAGLFIAIISGPLGCFVVWNRMAYFGDSLAHSSLLGVALALFFSINLYIGIFMASFSVACLLLVFGENKLLAKDTLLGILAHASLAIGLVLTSFMDSIRFDLNSFLFGDILSVAWNEIFLIGGLSLTCLILLIWRWKQLLMISIDEDLAHVEGINVRAYRSLLVFLLAALIALSIKIIGVLLISALLIIPAATARLTAQTPSFMAVCASLLAATAILGGLFFSWFVDTPAGPSIVVLSFLTFLITFLAAWIMGKFTH